MHALPAKHPLAFRFGSLIPLMLLLFLAPGCCGLFQPTEASVKSWATRQIPVGTSRTDVVWVIKSHGLEILVNDARGIYTGFQEADCVDNHLGNWVEVTVDFDSHQRTTDILVNKRNDDGGFHCRCWGKIQSTEDKTKAWVKREILLGMTKEQAIQVLTAHGLQPDQYQPEGRVLFSTIAKGCVDGSGGDIELAVPNVLDQAGRVKGVSVCVIPPDGNF